jgi:hypothetical protein
VSIGSYLIANTAQEVALARSAAPPAISNHASVLSLGPHGYSTVVKGTNGFVCLVVRSWDNSTKVNHRQFWNPQFRAPYCFNAAAARSMLPGYILRTQWILAGASESEIHTKAMAARSAGRISGPAPGAICYMMSKLGHLNNGGPWRPHVMIYMRHAKASDWGANLTGVPVFEGTARGHATFLVLVPVWSDGTPAPGFH